MGRALLGLCLSVLIATCTVLLVSGVVANADSVQTGKLLVSFDAGLKPSTLPRDRLVPVKVGFKGTFENLDASDTPPLRTMLVRLSRGGRIDSEGLPSCSEARLRGLNSSEALRLCAKAQIGEGTVSSAFRFPDGKRARAKAKLLLFNAPQGILMHLYTTEPLKGTFLVPMTVHRGSGAFGTVLRARFPAIAAGYGYLTGFEMVIHRTFTHRGKRRSYVVASCPAPSEFNRVAFELARVTYTFENGLKVRNAALRSCAVRGS
jgi:hypothetical protein